MAFIDWTRNQGENNITPPGKLPNMQSWGYTINSGAIRYGITSLYNSTSVSSTSTPGVINRFSHNNYDNLSHDHQVDIEATIYTNNVEGPTYSGTTGVDYGAFIGCWSRDGSATSLPAGFLACFERRSPAGNINSMSNHILLRSWSSSRAVPFGATTLGDGVVGIASATSSANQIIRLVATPISLSEKLLQVYYGGSVTPIFSYIVEATQPQWSATGKIVFGYYFRGFGFSGNVSTGNWFAGGFYDWTDEERRYPRLGFDYVNFNVTKYLSS